MITGSAEGSHFAMFAGMYDSREEQELLAQFIGQSVKPNTLKAYKPGFATWKAFLQTKTTVGMVADPYLRGQTEEVKVRLLSIFLMERYKQGKRDKQCTGITGAIKKFRAIDMQCTEWFQHPQIALCRKSCRRTPAELRAYVEAGEGKARLPAHLSMLRWMREEFRNRTSCSHG